MRRLTSCSLFYVGWAAVALRGASPLRLPSLHPCGSAMIPRRGRGAECAVRSAQFTIQCSEDMGRGRREGGGKEGERRKGGKSRKKQGWRANRMSRARTANDTEYSQLGWCASGKVASHQLERSRCGGGAARPRPWPWPCTFPAPRPAPAARQQQPCTLLALA